MTVNNAAAIRLERLIGDRDTGFYWTGLVHVLHLLGYIQRKYPTLDNTEHTVILVACLAIISDDLYEEKTDANGKISYTFKNTQEHIVSNDTLNEVFSTILNDCYYWSICKENNQQSTWKDYDSFKFEQLFGFKLDG